MICTTPTWTASRSAPSFSPRSYRLTPTHIQLGGTWYIVESPLFEITYRRKTRQDLVCLFRKGEADIVRQAGGEEIHCPAVKGLGENDPEMMWLTTMNPETRRLVRMLPDDAEETGLGVRPAAGDNLAGRKDYIAENGHLYLDMIDVS